MAWPDLYDDSTDSYPGGPNGSAGSPIRSFLSSGLGQFLIPLATAAVGALQRRPSGPYGATRMVGLPGALEGGLHGLDSVVRMQDQEAVLAEQQRQRAGEERVGRYLKPAFQRLGAPTTVQEPQIETEAGDVPIGTRPVEQPASERAQRLAALGQALLGGGQTGAAANLYAQRIPKEEPDDFTLGAGQARFRGKEKIAELPATFRPRAPIVRDMGNRVDIIDPETLGVIRSAPKGAAPARQESDLERRNTESQIQERAARTNRIKNAVAKSNDPKATLGQLSSSLNALLRERDSIETPDDEKEEIGEAVRVIRRRIVDLGGQSGGGGAPAGLPAGSKAIGKTKDGKMVYQTPDGKKLVAE